MNNELPPSEPAEPVGETPEQNLAEHEAQFGSEGHPSAADPEPEPDEESRQPSRERGQDGKFVKPEKHRAKSQEAGPKDVPRIQELTRKLRETEAERDAWRARSTTPPPSLPTAPAVPRETPPPATTATTKPKIEDFSDYGAYVEAVADWKIAEARRVDRETSQREAADTQLRTAWRARTEEAKTRYPDFEQVALMAPTRIPPGSLVDAWILEHRSGADVLYTLQQHPEELDRVLALPLFDQVEALTLLGQRMVPPREPAVKTGAAATPLRAVAPRPPTPVRTSAMPTTDEPPGDNASLAEHERFYHRPRR